MRRVTSSVECKLPVLLQCYFEIVDLICGIEFENYLQNEELPFLSPCFF